MDERSILKIGSPIFDDTYTLINLGGVFFPYQYYGDKEELLACRESAWIGISLLQTPVSDICGEDAIPFLNSICVNNDFAKLKDDGCRHAIICNKDGYMLADGVVLKVSENRFRTYWLAPVIDFYAKVSNLNVHSEPVTEYFFQIDGPKSLEIMEDACECDLHDLKFGHQKMVKIHGMDMRILRLGMSGSLAYEVHGPMDEAGEVYKIIMEAGRKYGAKPLGVSAYCVNHTQAGYANQNIHYSYPVESDPKLAEYMNVGYAGSGAPMQNIQWIGSCGDDPSAHYFTPYDVGWGNLVKFNHEFQGREALEKIAKNPPKTPVTLVWNPEDIAKVYATQFMGQDVEPLEDFARYSVDMYYNHKVEGNSRRADKVMLDGRQIGVTSGRIQDYYHHRMISMGFIEPDKAIVGNEVTIIWGTEGKPQMNIRAEIAPCPYFDEAYRNETFDVEAIPHKYGRKQVQ